MNGSCDHGAGSRRSSGDDCGRAWRWSWQQSSTAMNTIKGSARDNESSKPLSRASTSGFPRPLVPGRARWSMGMLNDKQTDEVPGTVLLFSTSPCSEPFGYGEQAPASDKFSPDYTSTQRQRQQQQRRQRKSLQQTRRRSSRSSAISIFSTSTAKRTPDGQVILQPQPEDSLNDPLNWPMWRRDAALFSLGFLCMIGGGATPILAAGYNDVAEVYGVSPQKIALTTGFYMLGLGVGSVIMSPTAILFGKRPVYLFGVVMFIVSAIWCAASPNYTSLLLARVFQGVAVSPVECLPSATIAEIFFLHERAYRIGIYTLLMLGGKNLIPLISAAITQKLGWRWVFWMVAIVVGFAGILVFLFVPETFWDRTPRPRAKKYSHRHRQVSPSILSHPHHINRAACDKRELRRCVARNESAEFAISGPKRKDEERCIRPVTAQEALRGDVHDDEKHYEGIQDLVAADQPSQPILTHLSEAKRLGNCNAEARMNASGERQISMESYVASQPGPALSPPQVYTDALRDSPPQTFAQCFRIWNGRISHDSWIRAAIRPFILFAYPAVLWSSALYALSVGWLIVLSEAVAEVYRSAETYNFSAMSAGLIYISPLVGGIIGTAVAGRLSDTVVQFMTLRNGGVYEPEFRLTMAVPITLTTGIGLMGFGWSAESRDSWIVPTVFFGVLSFGCTFGSTTAITFCVDSYRQYAGEALVTLNFSKNIFHGFVFAWFLVQWLQSSGNKVVFVTLGAIHIFFMLWSIPMYIYGKRARMWTVRKNLLGNI